VHEGAEPIAQVTIDRAEDFVSLTMGAPVSNDFVDTAIGSAARFLACNPDNKYPPHRRSGAVGDHLPRLNDGAVAQNNDDVDRCVWYDQQGRFYCDLGAPHKLDRINTYSWHRDERAPQFFSLWGASGEAMPGCDFAAGASEGWTLLGIVDTRDLGNGGKHCSSVHGLPAESDSYRYLLWVAEDIGQGTFFTEVDVYVTP
jgi:hypothetical protein